MTTRGTFYCYLSRLRLVRPIGSRRAETIESSTAIEAPRTITDAGRGIYKHTVQNVEHSRREVGVT